MYACVSDFKVSHLLIDFVLFDDYTLADFCILLYLIFHRDFVTVLFAWK